MAQLKLKDIEMDSLEILYYERQAARKKAYAAKKRKLTQIKEKTVRNKKIEKGSGIFDINLRKSIYNMC